MSLVVTTPGVRRQIFKPYRNSYRTSNQRGGQVDVEIKDVDFVFDDKAAQPQFWIWWGITDLPGTVGDDRVAGFRFRKNNIALGEPDRVADLFAEKKARRIADSTHGMSAKSTCCVPVPFPTLGGMALRTRGHGLAFGESCFRSLRPPQTSTRSSVRNAPAVKLAKQATEVIGAVETSRNTAWRQSKSGTSSWMTFKKPESKIESRLKGRSGESDGRELKPLVRKLERAEKQLQDDKHFVAKRCGPHSIPKQRQLLQEVANIIHSVLEQQACKKSRECGARHSQGHYGEVRRS